MITNSQQRVFTNTCVRLITACRMNVISEMRRGRCLEIAVSEATSTYVSYISSVMEADRFIRKSLRHAL